jgi:hypothetical protein
MGAHYSLAKASGIPREDGFFFDLHERHQIGACTMHVIKVLNGAAPLALLG